MKKKKIDMAETNFAELLPPLSEEEFEALKKDVKANGVLVPVFVDEDGEVLDGRHRLRIDPNAPRKVIRGLSPGEKEAFVFRANFTRRNLSPAQKAEARQRMKLTAVKLRTEDKKKWTQARVAAVLGVTQGVVSQWFGGGGRARTNITCNNTSTPLAPLLPDARVKINPKHKPIIAERVEAGETQAQVAADYGVSQRQISTIVKAEKKTAEVKEARQEAAKKRETDCGVICGDFRIFGAEIEDDSVDLILTDPPYDSNSIDLYRDAATMAARVLTPGGWLLAYSGKTHIPQVLSAMCVENLTYGWTFCVLHSGGDARFRKFHLQTGWKPVFAFYKPPLQVDWEWFKDVISGGKEKDSHEWQQAEAEATYFIEHLCPAHGTVCDPCCGSGTTLVAAKKLGRKWMGCEINEDHVETARSRLDDCQV